MFTLSVPGIRPWYSMLVLGVSGTACSLFIIFSLVIVLYISIQRLALYTIT